ncbi:anti-sigma factor family protein [Planctomycetaceae bacterium SH139]
MKYEESMLSGFIDGELSPAEEQVVQRQLAASPKDRQLLESLSRLHAQLRAAPPEVFSSDPVAAVRSRIAQGDPDSAAQVAAAKNLRTDSRDENRQPPAIDHQQTAQQLTARQPNARDGWRITRWLALAVAASLTGLLLWLPQRQAKTLTDNRAPSERPAPRGRIAEEPDAVSLQEAAQPSAAQPSNTELNKEDGRLELALSAAPEPPAAARLEKASPGSRSARMLAPAGDQAAASPFKPSTPFRIGRANDEVLAPLTQPLSAELANELNRRFVAIELPANNHLIAARFIADQLRGGRGATASDMQPTTDGAPGAAIAASRPDVVDTDQAGAGLGGEAALRGGGGTDGAAASTANEDENAPTAILVEGTPEELASLVQSLQQWSIRGGEKQLSDYQARGAENSFAINSYAASEAAGGAVAAEPDASSTSSTELGPEVREGVLAGRLWIVLRPQPATANLRPSADNPKSQSQP